MVLIPTLVRKQIYVLISLLIIIFLLQQLYIHIQFANKIFVKRRFQRKTDFFHNFLRPPNKRNLGIPQDVYKTVTRKIREFGTLWTIWT